jgi:hypothetical protein
MHVYYLRAIVKFYNIQGNNNTKKLITSRGRVNKLWYVCPSEILFVRWPLKRKTSAKYQQLRLSSFSKPSYHWDMKVLFQHVTLRIV